MPIKQDYSQQWWGIPQCHMETSYKVVTPAAQSALTVAEVKANLRITWSTEDALLQTYIDMAEAIIMEEIEVVYQETEFLLSLDEFPNEIQIEKHPVSSVDSITYTDLNGDSQSLVEDTDYYVDLNSFPVRIWSAVNLATASSNTRFWPDVKQKPGCVQVAFTAGYEDRDSVDRLYKQLIHLWVGHLYQHKTPVEQGRPAKVPHTIDDLTMLARKQRLG